jgi:hypothetical protein
MCPFPWRLCTLRHMLIYPHFFAIQVLALMHDGTVTWHWAPQTQDSVTPDPFPVLIICEYVEFGREMHILTAGRLFQQHLDRSWGRMYNDMTDTEWPGTLVDRLVSPRRGPDGAVGTKQTASLDMQVTTRLRGACPLRQEHGASEWHIAIQC